MARVVEEPLRAGRGSASLDPLVDEAAREVQRARDHRGARRPRAGGLGGSRARRCGRGEPRRRGPRCRRRSRAGSGSRGGTAPRSSEELLYAAVAVRRGRPTASAWPGWRCRWPGVEEQVRELRGRSALALLLAFLITAPALGALASPLAGPLREIMDAARQFAAGNLAARIRVSRDRRARRAGPHPQPVGRRSCSGRLTENARDRARTEAILAAMEDGVLAVDHRGHVLLANNALRRGLDLDGPAGPPLPRGDPAAGGRRGGREGAADRRARRRARWRCRHLRRVFSLTGVALPGRRGAAARRRADLPRRDGATPRWSGSGATSWPTPRTSCARRSPRSAASSRRWRTARCPSPTRPSASSARSARHADRMAALVEDLLELSRLESGERPPAVGGGAARPRSWRTSSPPSRAWRSARPIALARAGRRRARRGHRRRPAAPHPGEPGGQRDQVHARGRARRGRGRGRGPTGARCSRSRTTGPASPPSTCRGSSSASTGWTRRAAASWAAPGLGLAIVKHLAEGMGAAVTVASELDKGTVFTVAVPAGREHAAEAKAAG